MYLSICLSASLSIFLPIDMLYVHYAYIYIHMQTHLLYVYIYIHIYCSHRMLREATANSIRVALAVLNLLGCQPGEPAGHCLTKPYGSKVPKYEASTQKPYLDPKSLQHNSSFSNSYRFWAIVLHTFGVQVVSIQIDRP